MVIQIKVPVIQWLMEQLGYSEDESIEFAQEFVAMLIVTQAFGDAGIEPTAKAEEGDKQ